MQISGDIYYFSLPSGGINNIKQFLQFRKKFTCSFQIVGPFQYNEDSVLYFVFPLYEYIPLLYSNNKEGVVVAGTNIHLQVLDFSNYFMGHFIVADNMFEWNGHETLQFTVVSGYMHVYWDANLHCISWESSKTINDMFLLSDQSHAYAEYFYQPGDVFYCIVPYDTSRDDILNRIEVGDVCSPEHLLGPFLYNEQECVYVIHNVDQRILCEQNDFLLTNVLFKQMKYQENDTVEMKKALSDEYRLVYSCIPHTMLRKTNDNTIVINVQNMNYNGSVTFMQNIYIIYMELQQHQTNDIMACRSEINELKKKLSTFEDIRAQHVELEKRNQILLSEQHAYEERIGKLEDRNQTLLSEHQACKERIVKLEEQNKACMLQKGTILYENKSLTRRIKVLNTKIDGLSRQQQQQPANGNKNVKSTRSMNRVKLSVRSKTKSTWTQTKEGNTTMKHTGSQTTGNIEPTETAAAQQGTSGLKQKVKQLQHERKKWFKKLNRNKDWTKLKNIYKEDLEINILSNAVSYTYMIEQFKTSIDRQNNDTGKFITQLTTTFKDNTGIIQDMATRQTTLEESNEGLTADLKKAREELKLTKNFIKDKVFPEMNKLKQQKKEFDIKMKKTTEDYLVAINTYYRESIFERIQKRTIMSVFRPILDKLECMNWSKYIDVLLKSVNETANFKYNDIEIVCEQFGMYLLNKSFVVRQIHEVMEKVEQLASTIEIKQPSSDDVVRTIVDEVIDMVVIRNTPPQQADGIRITCVDLIKGSLEQFTVNRMETVGSIKQRVYNYNAPCCWIYAECVGQPYYVLCKEDQRIIDFYQSRGSILMIHPEID